MFNLFGSSKIIDPNLGEFTRSRGYWRGTVAIDVWSNVPLIVAGERAAPEPEALAAAKAVAAHFPDWRAVIEQALYEHCEPYAKAIASGELLPPDEQFAGPVSPSDVWPHVSLVFVCVKPLDGSITVELAMNVDWDEEHTLGARFRDGKFVELCGSTVSS